LFLVISARELFGRFTLKVPSVGRARDQRVALRLTRRRPPV